MQRSSTALPPKVHAAHVTADEAVTESPAATRKRNPLLFGLAALAALVVLLVGAIFAYGAVHDGRVYRGVRVLGADLGGKSEAEARAALDGIAAGYPSGAVTIDGAGRSWTFQPAELGVALDADKTLADAMSVGRSGDSLGNLGTQLRTLFNGSQVAPILKNDPAMIDKAIARVATDVDKAPVDSTLQIANGSVAITPSSTGRVVDRDATRAAILAVLGSAPFAPASVTVKDAQPKINEAMLKSAESQALLLIDQPVTLRSGEKSWTIDSNELGQMLDISSPFQGTEGFQVSLNGKKLAEYLQPVAEAVKLAPEDASVVVGKGTVTLKPDVPGAELDTAGAVSAIQKATTGTDAASRTVDVPLSSVPAARHTADVQALFDKANALVTQGVRVRFRDDGYIMRGTAVTGFIDVAESKDEARSLKLVVDEDVLANRVSGIAYNINRPAVDARFRLVNGSPSKIAEAKEGYKVDVAASTQAALQAIQAYTGGDRLQVDLAVNVTQPDIKDADLGAINTPDLLGTGQTSYAGSSAERAWNVGLGTRNVDGALIPPGGTFSTVEAIGDLTLAAGFKMGYAIVSNGSGGLTTVPAEAGGICQVATTLFHSVFWAGLPIVERNWHSYWIGLYGVRPSGLQGLDATIAPPEKDFRFKNTTGNWLLIRSSADGKNVTFQVYGVNPGWKVNVSGPVITKPVKTNPAMITEYSNKLPAGKTVLVEHAQDGFDAQITRTVVDGSGSVVDKWVARSHYQPAHNRTLIGTGK